MTRVPQPSSTAVASLIRQIEELRRQLADTVDALRAVHEAIALPYPATVGDGLVYDQILAVRLIHVRTFLGRILDSGGVLSLSRETGYLRERLAEHPAEGYRTWHQVSAEQAARQDGGAGTQTSAQIPGRSLRRCPICAEEIEMKQTAEPKQDVETRSCIECDTPAGRQCTPEGHHLGRYLDAEKDGILDRSAVCDAVAKLTVISRSAVVPSPEGTVARPELRVVRAAGRQTSRAVERTADTELEAGA